jgi:hypothetical protein
VESRAEEYRARAERFEAAAEALERRSRLLSNLRGSSFGVFAIAGLFAAFGDTGTPVGALCGAGFLAFLGLIVVHDRIIRRQAEERRYARVNRDALSRVSGDLSKLDGGAGLIPDGHPYAADLDLVGSSSLFQRISTARSPRGRVALAAMLATPAPFDVLGRRQEAVRALAPELELRQRVESLALGVAEPRGGAAQATAIDPGPFVAWAEQSPVLGERRAFVIAARSLPVLTIGLATASGFGFVPVWSWLSLIVVQVFMLATVGRETGNVFAAVSQTEGALACYGPLFEVLEELTLDVELIRRLRQRLTAPERRPSLSMRRFQRIVGWFELRHNGLVHPFINAFTLWDVHCVLALERWQMESGREVRGWLDAVGELEALASFAALSYDEPRFCWPEVEQGPAHFVAQALGHPLIREAHRVGNDVAIESAGHGLLITGSNMSGKSTLLRSVGLATVMALAGAPVCATRLRVGWCTPRTSLRIRDSLESGVSHFYAEVSKLKVALDASMASIPILFLLDEILHGTNSEERQVGARWVLAQLLASGAIGIVTTHDAKLCQLEPPLSERLEQFHFREDVANGAMHFDYRLRPGPVQGGNALRVMRLLGINVPVDG